ncbi:MAG: polysaccharide biosynthesis C-terminal domain-containing protein [Collinsella sp.]
MGGIFTATKDTKTLSFTTISGALVNVVLNFALIPIFGAMGAAMATMLGYGGVLVARIIALRKHIQMRVSWRKVGFTYALLFVQLVVSAFGVMLIPLRSCSWRA